MDTKPFKNGSLLSMEVFVSKVAALAAEGCGQQAIAKALSDDLEVVVTWRDVKKALEHPKYKEIVAQMSGDIVYKARSKLKAATAKLVDKVVHVLEQHLDDGNLNAVPHALKILGIEAEEKAQPASLTVVLPNIKEEPKEVSQVEDVKYEVQKPETSS